MQVPKRKAGKYTYNNFDPNLTPEKFQELTQKLEHLKNTTRLSAMREVKRLSETGDYSDNPGYSLAKGRLRSINDKILELEDRLKKAIIIKPLTDQHAVQLGHTVVLQTPAGEKTYKILGPSETDPEKGIISHKSPLGQALMGQQLGAEILLPLKDKTVKFKLLKIY